MNGLDFTAISKLKLLIKSKKLKKREKSTNFDTILRKICIINWQIVFTIEIVAQFCMKLKKNYLHPMNGLDFTAISKLKLLIKSKNLKKRQKIDELRSDFPENLYY